MFVCSWMTGSDCTALGRSFSCLREVARGVPRSIGVFEVATEGAEVPLELSFFHRRLVYHLFVSSGCSLTRRVSGNVVLPFCRMRKCDRRVRWTRLCEN